MKLQSPAKGAGAPKNCAVVQADVLPPANIVLTAKEAALILGISVPTLLRRVADKTVPKPIKLGGATRWIKTEILAVIEAAMAARK